MLLSSRPMAVIVLLGLAGLMPVAIMTSQVAPSAIFYLMVLAGMVTLWRHRTVELSVLHRQYRWLFVCLAAPLAAVAFSSLWNHQTSGTDWESSLRFLLGGWVLTLAFSQIAHRQLRLAIWGFGAAALAASGFVLYLVLSVGGRPDTDAVYNAVGYGNLMALLATLVLFSVRWTLTRWPRAERLVKLLLFTVTLIGFMVTQTRTGWVAVPAFVFIGAVLFAPPKRPARTIITATVALALLATVFTTNDTLRQRAVLAYHEATACSGADRVEDTSICIRLQLWRASLGMLSEHPVAGIGSRGLFNHYLNTESLPRGIVSPYVAEGWGEPHNDVILALASYGIPGGLALLLIYLGPVWVFVRRLFRGHAESARTAAAMGLAVCLGFLLFGMAETMFRSMRTVSFYAMCVALFLALSDAFAQKDSAAP